MNKLIHYRSDRSALHAFTLVELLVVIAIIALVASLLLPVLARAKQAAHSAVCKNNLRQWGLGLIMYVGDFGVYPHYEVSDPGEWWQTRMWYERLEGYTPSASPDPLGSRELGLLAFQPLASASLIRRR